MSSSIPFLRPVRSIFARRALTLLALCAAVAPWAEARAQGQYNTAYGTDTLKSDTTGNGNTAIGWLVLSRNTSGNENTAVGYFSMLSNTTGNSNVALGGYALQSNMDGSSNTATGNGALANNTEGSYNSATGYEALFSNTTGINNTASGYSALHDNLTGGGNTAEGSDALGSNTTGFNNVGVGANALSGNKTGDYNTAAGTQALGSTTSDNNTGFGFWALLNNTTGSNNVALGYQAGSLLTTGSNNIDIGALGTKGESNTIRIGKANTQKNAFIQGIYGSPVSGGQQVYVNSAGKIGVLAPSSARFKEDIQPMDHASDALLALKPVTFRYKEEMQAGAMPQFGLVAEEVEKVAPELVVRSEEGKIDGIRYEAVNAMLLNEFLKAHRTIQEQGAMLAEQQKQIDTLTSAVQQVNARVESRTTNPPVAANEP